jgi:hypothetical protein
MNKKFEERLITIDSDEGRKARDEVLDRFERVQREEEITQEFIKARKEFDIKKINEIYFEIHGENLPDDILKVLEELFALKIEEKHLEALLEYSEREYKAMKHESERLRFKFK